ncbi:MAG: shikimate dehydrogenase [Reichenbachiella sp.]|uniref:shikimate dehydrogenase family protein n=1 Tax=Reichenbachiella sp. TaxID=2184521 RepID=UPI00326778CF
MRRFGLIGKTLKHSFSKKYFTEKFTNEGITNCQYDLFELENISEIEDLLKSHEDSLVGLNVTIPYKKLVIPYLDEIDVHAQSIGAVNTIQIHPDGRLIGHNTDYFGFIQALKNDWVLEGKSALVLGTGGASEAVKAALTNLGIPYLVVSRESGENRLSYQELSASDTLAGHQLVINTTPLGTFPQVDKKPDLPYEQLTADHLLFDLVYNPEITAFMQAGLDKRAKVKNGYQMLVGQAEAAWEIWNTN